MARGELPVGGHQGIIHIRPQPDQRCAVRERHQPALADAGVGEWRPFGPAKTSVLLHSIARASPQRFRPAAGPDKRRACQGSISRT